MSDEEPQEKVDLILDEIRALRSEVDELRKSRGGPEGAVDRAAADFRILPDRTEDAFRWGFLGAWGKSGFRGAQHSCISVHTTTIESFLGTRTEEEVAAFAQVFTNADALRICRALWRRGGKATRQDITDDCSFDGDAFLRGIEPLLEWHLVEWKGDRLESCGQGVNYGMTLTSMAIEGYKQRTGDRE